MPKGLILSIPPGADVRSYSVTVPKVTPGLVLGGTGAHAASGESGPITMGKLFATARISCPGCTPSKGLSNATPPGKSIPVVLVAPNATPGEQRIFSGAEFPFAPG